MKKKSFAKFTGFFGIKRTEENVKDTDFLLDISEIEKYERCVMCGKLTDVPVSLPINLRDNYISGMGQICDECAQKKRMEDNLKKASAK